MNPLNIKEWITNFSNPTHPLIIAGPCSAESEEQMLKTARELAAMDKTVNVFRAGIWKPRTRPNTFEGVGEKGLKWLSKVKEETGMLTTTEVANAHHVELALKHGVDILWVGARTTVNPFTVQEIANALEGTDTPIMVKNPINSDLALWLGALERFENVGVNKLIAIHRGFSSYEEIKYRNSPNWKIPIELKRICPSIPIICDPSHICGNRELIHPVSQKALDLGFAGLMIETHCDPDNALSDAKQQITPQNLNHMLTELELRKKTSNNDTFEARLEELRAKINRIDKEIIEALAERRDTVKEIGILKLKNNILPLQIERMNELMRTRIQTASEYYLNESYIKDLYQTIHTESIKVQTDMTKKD